MNKIIVLAITLVSIFVIIIDFVLIKTTEMILIAVSEEDNLDERGVLTVNTTFACDEHRWCQAELHDLSRLFSGSIFESPRVLHAISMILFLSRGHSFQGGAKGIPNLPFHFFIPGEGYGLGIIYLIWLLVVISLYPLCKWSSDYKNKNKAWWLSYL
jgi:hypothetical protein